MERPCQPHARAACLPRAHWPRPPRRPVFRPAPQQRRGALRPLLLATVLAAALTGAVAVTTGGPTIAVALHVPVFWLIAWTAAHVLPARWTGPLSACAVALVVLEALALVGG